MPAKSRKEKIMEVAEKMFAKRGFAGVSLRDITSKSGVDVALVNYHFGNKQALFDAVLQSRADTLNAERSQALDEVLARHDPAPVDEIIDAFTRPLLNRVTGEDASWRNYFGLIAQVNSNPEWGGRTMSRYFDPLVRRFTDALHRSLPGCRDADLFWCYHFLSGALTLTLADTGRIDALSGGACRSSDFESVHARLVPFIAAGFEAICQRQEN